jgi:dihydrofolate reductase
MTKVNAGITTSLDGYITGPDDGPGRGLGEGGERLHYWVFGGPWSYAEEPKGEATGADKELLDRAYATVGAVVGGRNTYEAAEAWGGQNPWGMPFFIVTHRPAQAPADAGFGFVNGLDEAIARARGGRQQRRVRDGRGRRDPSGATGRLRGGARDHDRAGRARGGKRLFEGFDESLNLEHVRLLQSPFATHITYRVLC